MKRIITWYKNIRTPGPAMWLIPFRVSIFDSFFESHINHSVGILGEMVDLILMLVIITAKNEQRRELQMKHHSITDTDFFS